MIDPRCGCCEGTEPRTPLPTANRPGLDALSYRVGTHATFLETMLARLSSHALADGRRPLSRLTTRDPDDPAIALLDAWATVADVLTFYQERIANEGYLLTATERRSIVELARLVGYRPRPGVAASVYLAFTLEKDYRIDIPAGTRAQSVPEPGELPQAFETDEALPARTEWNAIPARQTRPQYLQPVAAQERAGTAYLRGVVNTVKPNEAVLFVAGAAAQPYAVRAVAADPAADRTRFTFAPLGAGFVAPEPAATAILRARRAVIGDTGSAEAGGNGDAGGPALTRLTGVVQALRKAPSEQPPNRLRLGRSLEQTYSAGSDLGPRLLAQFEPRLRDTLYTAYANAPVTGVTPEELVQLEALRVKAAPFGHNAPQELVFEDNVPVGRREWALREFGGTARVRFTSTEADQTVTGAFRGHYDLLEEVNPLALEVRLVDDQGVTRFAESLEVRDLIDPGQAPFGEEDPAFTLSRTLDPAGEQEVEITAQYAGPFDDSPGAYDDARLEYVELTFRLSPGRVTSIRVAPPEPDIPVGTTGSQGGLLVTVDDDPVRQATPGSTITATIGSRSVRISLDGALEVTHRTPALATEEQLRTLSLDAAYEEIVPGSYVVVERVGTAPLVARVEQVRTVSRADYGIAAKATQLVLDRRWLAEADTSLALDPDASLALLRGITVHARSEPLELDVEPIEEDVAGSVIELDGLYEGLEAGRWLMVRGERADVLDAGGRTVEGLEASELVMLAGVEHDVQTITGEDGEASERPGDTLHTRLLLAEDLAYSYRRSTLAINANVVRATHGETRKEVLGSGNGAEPFQQFTLKQRPLTYLAAPTPAGVESTLEVRVNDVRLPEHPTLLYLDGDDRGYITRTDDDGRTTVVFGDGKHGSRLPTGVENVTAVYRSGIGKVGNAEASQISILATRPLGVKEVVNPQRASGGADAESRDQARRNLPLAVLALDRLVSVQDYADFARTFAGIGKASATVLSDGRREVVHLTIAGADDVPIDPTSDLFRNLMLALDRFGDPHTALQVAVREAVFLFLSAHVKVLEDHLWEKVEPKIRAGLLDAFGFDRRELGQDVLLSEVISLIQRVEGVDYVDVDLLEGVSETDALDPETLAAKLEALATSVSSPSTGSECEGAQPRQRLVVRAARIDPSIADPELRIQPAQLAYLNPELPDTLILMEVRS